MNIIAVNGSPRKKWNTATLLQHALDGAAQQGARVELVHLYDFGFTGCVSCFACKKIGGKSYGRCAVQDDLRPLLERIRLADGLILGTPVYFGVESGEMRCFLERLLFPYVSYPPGYASIFGRAMPTALIYAMNVSEQAVQAMGQGAHFERTRAYMTRVFGSCESLSSTDTCQFDDYGKYVSTSFDPLAKAARHKEVFPDDCAKARELGVQLAAAASAA